MENKRNKLGVAFGDEIYRKEEDHTIRDFLLLVTCIVVMGVVLLTKDYFLNI